MNHSLDSQLLQKGFDSTFLFLDLAFISIFLYTLTPTTSSRRTPYAATREATITFRSLRRFRTDHAPKTFFCAASPFTYSYSSFKTRQAAS